MTPIVFCASLVPWDNATSEAVAIWPQRKPSRRRLSTTLRVIRYTNQVPACGDQARDDRRGDRGDQHLACDTGPVDARQTQRRQARADQTAEERVRRAGRNAEQPRQQVPQDAADEAGEDDRQTRRRIDARYQGTGLTVLHLQHRGGDGDRDLDREEGADEVEDTRQQHSGLGLQRACGDRRRHRVAGVVEPVGEVECQCRHDQQHQDHQLCAHGANSAAMPDDLPN